MKNLTVDMVRAAIKHAQDKHGPRSADKLPPYEALAVLTEEVGEVSRALQEGNDKDRLHELVQVAAVAVMMIEGLIGYAD